MLNLTDTAKQMVRDFFVRLVPSNRTTVLNPWGEQAAMTERITVDRVHEIIESAKAGDPRDLFALYRDIIISDNHLQSEFSKRKLAVVGDTLSVQPREKDNPDDIVAARAVKNMIDNLRVSDPSVIENCSWIEACAHLMESTLYPVALVEKVYRPSSTPGIRYDLVELVAVPHQLLTYVSNQQDATGRLKIRRTNTLGYPTGETDEVDGNRYIVHRAHLLSTHDLWGGPMRSILFWWLLGTMDREWWARFLERYGAPFIVGKYRQGDDASRSIMERAFSYAVKIGGLVISKESEVELIQAASTSSAESYEKFIRLCNEEKSKLVIGQVLTTESKATGLGSGVANQHGKVRDDIRQFDAGKIAETLENQLCSQFLSINGLAGRVKLVWGAVSEEEKKALGELLTNLKGAGLEPADEALEDLSEQIGFPIQRCAPPPAMALHALAANGVLSDVIIDRVAEAGRAKLARTFRGSLAPVRQLILLSHSPEDLEKRLRTFYADWSPDRVADVIDQALTAYAANGAAK